MRNLTKIKEINLTISRRPNQNQATHTICFNNSFIQVGVGEGVLEIFNIRTASLISQIKTLLNFNLPNSRFEQDPYGVGCTLISIHHAIILPFGKVCYS